MNKAIFFICLLVFGITNRGVTQILSAEVISNAKAYLNFEWTAGADNIWNQVACGGKSVNTPDWVGIGDHEAMPYCWGGNSTLSQFTDYLMDGKSAGDDNTSAGFGAEPTCSIGVDCSGFVSRCFGLGTHYATSMLNVNALFGHHPSYDELTEADFINNPGSHTRLVTKINANGTITVIESGSGVGNVGSEGLRRVFTWTYSMSQLSQYNPQYYTNKIEGNAILDCSEAVELTCGETYQAGPSTAESQISFYGCNSWTETGPERVHTITPEMDGTLKANISNFSGDLDVYILGSCDPSDCLGIVTSYDAVYANVQGGHTYYIVVDSDDGSQSGYDLVVDCLTSDDLGVSSATVSSAELNPGESLEVSVYQHYSGSQMQGDLPGFVMEYYLSADCELSPEDVLLGVDTSDLGNDYPLVSETAELIIPEETLPGDYFILFVGDAQQVLNEENEANNIICVEIEVIDPAGLDALFQQQLSVFPNPTRDVIHITTEQGQGINELRVLDLHGRLIQTVEGANLNKLEIRELPAGQYILQVVGEEERKAVFRIVKG